MLIQRVAGVHYSRLRSPTCERWLAALFGGFALLTAASGCSGGEPRQGAERKSEKERSTETEPPDAHGDRTGTTRRSDPPESREGAAALVWVGVEEANELTLVDVARGEVVARHHTPGGPHNVVVAGDGTPAAALYASDRIALVRRDKPRFVDLGGSPHDVKATGDLLVVANEAARRVDLVEEGSMPRASSSRRSRTISPSRRAETGPG